jgi:hypothetical protein
MVSWHWEKPLTEEEETYALLHQATPPLPWHRLARPRYVRVHPEPFLKAIAPYRDGLAVAVECIFTWYWLADLCAQEGIPFVLGHVLYMKAIHGGKVENDKIDSQKIAALLRGGMLPQT